MFMFMYVHVYIINNMRTCRAHHHTAVATAAAKVKATAKEREPIKCTAKLESVSLQNEVKVLTSFETHKLYFSCVYFLLHWTSY